MGTNSKDLRKQLRNITQEILPELMKSEMFTQLQQENRDRLELIAADVKKALADIAQRQRDVQSMLLRDAYANVKTQPAEQPSATQEEAPTSSDNAT